MFNGINSPGIFNPGDTIVLRASDNPRSYFYMAEVHGTADQPITIINEGGQVQVSFDIEHCTHIKILGTGSADTYGFVSTGCSLHGRVSDIEVSNIDIDGGAFGFWIKNEASCDPSLQYPNWYINNIEVHHCRVRNITYEGMYCGSTDPNALWLDRNPIVCNGVPATQGQYKPTRLGNFKIHHNIFDKTGRAAIQLSDAELGISEIYNNTITNAGLEISDGQGNGINIGLYSKVYIHDNNIDYTYVWGIASLGGTYVRIENNTINHSGFLPASATRDGLDHSLVWPWAIIVSPRNTIPVENTTFIIKNNRTGSRGSLQTFDISVDDNGGNYPNRYNTDNIICGNTKLADNSPSDIDVTPGIVYTTNCVGNTPPTANAGNNQSIQAPASSVTLNGTGSDSDGTISSYAWTQVSGPTNATIQSPNSASTVVSALSTGIYTFRLTVTDNNGATGSSNVIITVIAAQNIAPVANAGEDKIITLPANSATLNGSGTDTDGTISSYNWTKTSGPTAHLIETPTSPTTIVSGLAAGIYTFTLTVTDNNGAVGTDTVQVTVNEAPPVRVPKSVKIHLPTRETNILYFRALFQKINTFIASVGNSLLANLLYDINKSYDRYSFLKQRFYQKQLFKEKLAINIY